jgi:hypothetical protein
MSQKESIFQGKLILFSTESVPYQTKQQNGTAKSSNSVTLASLRITSRIT